MLGGIFEETMMEQQIEECADEGRPVKPHRSGGGQRVALVGAGAHGLAIAAMLAMASASNLPVIRPEWGDRQEPINTGRRAEKDAAALAKAEAKRQRKMAKRAMAMPPN
jgi:threonine dehydrogenase-like Zn-dependent dehydrogenase